MVEMQPPSAVFPPADDGEEEDEDEEEKDSVAASLEMLVACSNEAARAWRQPSRTKERSLAQSRTPERSALTPMIMCSTSPAIWTVTS